MLIRGRMGKLSFFSKAVSQTTYPCLHACRLRAVCLGESHRHRRRPDRAANNVLSKREANRGERTSRALWACLKASLQRQSPTGVAHDALTKPFRESDADKMICSEFSTTARGSTVGFVKHCRLCYCFMRLHD